MKKIVVVCLAGLILWSLAVGSPSLISPETFALADRIGEPNTRSFFLFSTSAGNYAIRHDGMGEVSSPKGMRRVFYLNLGAKARIERVYFLEHERDLFLLYEVHNETSEWACLLRMEQTKRKPKWITTLRSGEIQAPSINGDLVTIKDTEISVADGRILRQD